jgi:hypothetical protein
MKARRAAVFFLVACSVQRVAAAQSQGTEVALAEMLYRQGRQLMADGKVSEACPKFAESYRLDPATGTLLNLAACHESEHKIATAWLEYSEGLNLARRDRRDDRIRFAQEHLAALEPKLSHLTIVVARGADVAELEIEVDRVPIRRAAWGVPAPLDPGDHTIEARAKGRKPWSKQVTLARESTNVTVTIPPLELEPVAEPNVPTPDAALRPPVSESPRPVPASVYVAGSLTVALAAGSISTGIIYLSRRSKYGTSEGDAEFDATRRWGIINLPLTGGAILGAAATTYLYLSRPSAPSSTRGATPMVVPWIGASSGGLLVEGNL